MSLKKIDILQAEHDVIGEALTWGSVKPQDIEDAYYYIFGVSDVVSNILCKIKEEQDNDEHSV